MMKNKKVAVLFSGGKDSVYATYIAKQEMYDVCCLITICSENQESFMFHTPSIRQTKTQAEVMGIPLIFMKTAGEKEKELLDLEKSIKKAKRLYHIEGIVTGAVESVYQSSRIQKICKKLNLDCFNPLWQKEQLELLNDLIKSKFDIVISGVFAYPLNKGWLGRKIDNGFIQEVKVLNEKYKINPAGDGGEFESFVLNCPLFKNEIKIKGFEDFGSENSWRREFVT